MQQPRLFGDYRWNIGRRMAHVVPRTDGTGYRIRIRWSDKLGLQLDHTFITYSRAVKIAEQIELRGWIDMSCWKKIFRPQWNRHCETVRRPS